MHQDCPDFDLCDICEAHPIALHPKSHPLLKMKTPEVLVSSICTQESSFPFASSRGTQPEEVGDGNDRPQLIPVPPEPSSPFVWGYMRASSLSNEPGLQTPVVHPKLIPRLDEISPSLIRIPLEEEHSRLNPTESVDRNDEWPLLTPHVDEKVEEGPENRVDEMGLSNSAKHYRESGCLDSETTWPAAATELAHLIPSVDSPSLCDISVKLEQRFQPSPLTGEEPLLSAPVEAASSDMQQKSVPPVTVSRQTLAMLLGEQGLSPKFESPSVVSLEDSHPILKDGTSESGKQLQSREEEDGRRKTSTSEKVEQIGLKKDTQEVKDKMYLTAIFIEDVTVSDGQVFPPGAEFMKCWRMLNDSDNDWPEATELVCVAGEMLGTTKDATVSVGLVKSGNEIELWTGELKVCTAVLSVTGY
jgi:next-to-BRCA1 protein 1